MLFGLEWYRARLSTTDGTDGAFHALRAEKRSRCEGAQSAEEAWELCAPGSWSDRAFGFVATDGSVAAVPSTVGRVVAFCSRPESIETGETLARELVARLVAHGAEAQSSVRWRFWPEDLWKMGALPPMRWSGEESPLVRAGALVKDAAVEPAIVRAIETHSRDRLTVSIALWCARWDAARVEPNPFEPLVELYAMGVALVALSPLELAIAD